MSNESYKISELTTTSIVPENSLIPISTNKNESSSVNLNTLRASLWFENAYDSIEDGTNNTVKDDVFFVYEDENKTTVLGYLNQGGNSYSPLVDQKGNQIKYLTTSGYKTFSGINITNIRSYWENIVSENGKTLVSGTFETGGQINDQNDVLLSLTEGKCYLFKGIIPSTVSAGQTPDDDWEEMSFSELKELNVKKYNQTESISGAELTIGSGNYKAKLTVSPTGGITSQFCYKGMPFSPVASIPYVRSMNRMSKRDKYPLRELVIPLDGASDYLSSPKLAFKTTKNNKLEVWAVHPLGGRNKSNYQDLVDIDSGMVKTKNHRYRYKLMDKDDIYENIILMRYKPSQFKNVYANFGGYDATTGWSTFNFFFYFSQSVASIMGVNGEANLFNRFAEVVSKKYLNNYLVVSDANGKYSVAKIRYAATSQGDYQLVLRVLLKAEPNGTPLTGSSSQYVTGYYGQSGASSVSYKTLEIITTSEELVTGDNLSSPYTISNGQYVYLNATGHIDAVINQSTTSLPYNLKTVVTNVTLDTSVTPNALTKTTDTVKEVNSNVYSGLCSHHDRMYAVKDRLRTEYYRSTNLIDVLGDYGSGYDYVYYVGTAQKFSNHTDTEEEYVNG